MFRKPYRKLKASHCLIFHKQIHRRFRIHYGCVRIFRGKKFTGRSEFTLKTGLFPQKIQFACQTHLQNVSEKVFVSDTVTEKKIATLKCFIFQSSKLRSNICLTRENLFLTKTSPFHRITYCLYRKLPPPGLPNFTTN